jgi:acyl-CoA thioester hydrolase
VYEYVYQHRVRYRECDPMGVVYHTHYLDYFEAARTEALRDLGIAYRDIEAGGIIMPVIDLDVQYKRPAHYDDMLDIVTRFETMPSVRVPIAYTVQRTGDADVLATGTVTLCFMDAERRRPTRPPAAMRHTFEQALAD